MGLVMFGSMALGAVVGGLITFLGAGASFWFLMYAARGRRLVWIVGPATALGIALLLFQFIPHEFFGVPTGGEDHDTLAGNFFVMFLGYFAVPGISGLIGACVAFLCPRNPDSAPPSSS